MQVGIPRQIPPRDGDYVDREEVLAEIARLVTDESDNRTVVLKGLPKIGKTAVAVEVMHRLWERFPDGQLFCELSEGDAPRSVSDILQNLLVALGDSATDIPDRPDARHGRYLTVTRGRKLLVVLDGAVTAAQLRWLRPADGGSLVVVTGRASGTDLGIGATTVFEVDRLRAGHSRELLARMVGADRLAAEPEAVRRVLAMCDDVPYALRVIGTLIRNHPSRPIAMTTDLLRVDGRWSVALKLPEIFDAAYSSLSTEAACCYRALGSRAHSGWLSIAALAAVLEMSDDEIAWAVAELAELHLVQEKANGCRATSVVRVHARTVGARVHSASSGVDSVDGGARMSLAESPHASSAEGGPQVSRAEGNVWMDSAGGGIRPSPAGSVQRGSTGGGQVVSAGRPSNSTGEEWSRWEQRLIRYYDSAFAGADVLLAPARPWRRLLFPGQDFSAPVAGEFTDASGARAWLRTHLGNIAALSAHQFDSGRGDLVARWCMLLFSFHEKDKHLDTMRAMHEQGLAQSKRMGTPAVRCLLHIQLGFLHYWLRELPESVARFRAALAIDRTGFAPEAAAQLEASACEGLGLALLARGETDQARDILRRNRTLAAAIADPRRIALAALHSAKVEDPDSALALLDTAAATFATSDFDETENLAKVRMWRGRKLIEQGEPTAAEPLLTEALSVMRDRRRRFDEAEVLMALGDCLLTQAGSLAARDQYQAALTIYSELRFDESARLAQTRLRDIAD
ncbi:tetratricopeptide repeat protein [Nocardia panacis]|nr:tetratricopeptide repeat protein [Nocardia panacis]